MDKKKEWNKSVLAWGVVPIICAIIAGGGWWLNSKSQLDSAISPTAIEQAADRTLATVLVNPANPTATITLPNGNTIIGTRKLQDGVTFFTFYSDGSTETIRLKVPENMVLVCTDDAVIEKMDTRGKSFIQSRQANPSSYFTKAYGGAIVSIANYPNGKIDVWCSAN